MGSGVTKVAVGHGFDTVKTRLQCAPPGLYKGPWDCFVKTVRNEGPLALYKGATPPAVGWAFIDSLLIGSLHNYRLFLIKHGWTERLPSSSTGERRLTLSGHAVAGLWAGWTSCIIAMPVDTLKVKLQLQMTRDPKEWKYRGSIDCMRQIFVAQGPLGLYRGFTSMLLFRSCFASMFTSYELLLRGFRALNLSDGTGSFLAGGLGSFSYWAFAIPFDNIKNRILADDLVKPKYSSSSIAMGRRIYAEGGLWNFYRGFWPVVLRAFPVNASAFFVFEHVLRLLGAEKVRRIAAARPACVLRFPPD
ncbi:mitochondrial carrier [Dacryopinax primogenitus]|uniref:Mitochondrial carrier n=1 Tax=Dacryopinax primogenitus (strain DJM 731) TaxID=1858805 RepID=M5FXA1_DACPD|nr:mitochondrial carrier [Dacryopinax primogenitus]EJU01074.1 mitochondrial carrier [Dacryopinax primogenitus]